MPLATKFLLQIIPMTRLTASPLTLILIYIYITGFRGVTYKNVICCIAFESTSM
jgi:hypothetical protein